MNNISLKNLCVDFLVDNGIKNVMQDLNLELQLNKISVVVGKSGCGKTTLLRSIAGLEVAKEGSVNLNGAKLGFVFQEPRLMQWLNVYENIIFGLKDKEIDSNKIENLLTMVELNDYKNFYPSQLSGGMQSRVSLARALAYEPDYLLMDEPFAALDYFTRINMQQELLKICKNKNLGILFVTHNIDEAITIGDRILVMSDKNINYECNLENVNKVLLSEEVANIKKEILEEIRNK